MKTPICELCASSGVLCSGCEAKLAAGKISQLDVEVSKLLYAFRGEYELSEASFTRAVDLGKAAVIFTNGNAGVLIGREARVVSALGKKLEKNVRIAKQGGDLKQTIADIVSPAKLLGVNEVFSAGGKKYKVRIDKNDFKALPLDLDSLNKILSTLFEGDVKIEFE